MRLVLLAVLLAAAVVLTAGACGPDEPSGPDLKDFASPGHAAGAHPGSAAPRTDAGTRG